MSERIKSLSEIKDPEAFLAAYYAAMDDAKETRAEVKRLREQAEEAGSDEEISKWKSRALKAEAKSNLERQGIKDPERILKYINLDGVDFDEDGAVTGLDDKVNEVKADFPELFDAKRKASRASADIHADTPPKANLSSTEAQVARLFK